MARTPEYVVDSCDMQHLISGAGIIVQFQKWFGSSGLLHQFDVFISHQWPDRTDKSNVRGLHDEQLVESMYKRLMLYSIEASNRSIDTFLDSRRLQDGKDCIDDFAKALVKSTLVVSIISR